MSETVAQLAVVRTRLNVMIVPEQRTVIIRILSAGNSTTLTMNLIVFSMLSATTSVSQVMKSLVE